MRENCANHRRYRDCWGNSLPRLSFRKGPGSARRIGSRSGRPKPDSKSAGGHCGLANCTGAVSSAAGSKLACPRATAQATDAHNHGVPAAAAPSDASGQRPPASAATSAPQVVAQAPVRPAPQASAAAAAPGSDAQAGRLVYRKCQACHSLEAGKNTLGPSLAGIFGKKAAEVPNFNYSPALKASNIVWDVAALDAYLLDPQKAVPGNKMPFPGLKTENERKDVIAYLAGGASPAAGRRSRSARRLREPARSRARGRPSAAARAAASTRRYKRSVSYIPDVRYTLRSGIAEGRMVYLGVGGTIDGQVNPLLSAAEGQVVQITLINGEGAEHDIVFPEQERSPRG